MNKYHARITYRDGIRFQSAREAARFGELQLLERAGEIHDLELQVRFDLVVNDHKIGFYKADFRYTTKDGQSITEDAKGVRTAVYALKKRLVEALYAIRIEEV